MQLHKSGTERAEQRCGTRYREAAGFRAVCGKTLQSKRFWLQSILTSEMTTFEDTLQDAVHTYGTPRQNMATRKQRIAFDDVKILSTNISIMDDHCCD